MKRTCAFLLFLFISSSTYIFPAETAIAVGIKNSPNPLLTRFDTLDDYARKTPKEYEKNTKTLAQYLIIPAKSQLEKARLLFTWVATHVKYDDAAFNTGKYKDQAAASVLKSKKSVCEGYSNLLKDLCTEAGLEAERVVGYSKGYGYKTGHKFSKSDHAWNVIKIDGVWKLFDVTWASGYATKVNGKLKSTTRFDPYWFDVNPKEFIFSHLPEESNWQLLDESITLKKYEKMPKLDDTFFKLGFGPDKVYFDAVSGEVKEFAETYTVPCPVKGVQLPYSSSIPRSESTRFVLESDQATDIMLLDGKTWVPFAKEGNTFTLSHQPKHKKVSIALKTSKNGKTYATILKYKATK